MPKTFLHQHWQRNRRLYLMGWNTGACGICTVMDQNIHRMQDSWARKTRTNRTELRHDEQQGAMVGSMREGWVHTSCVTCEIRTGKMNDNWAFLSYWKLCPWIKHLISNVGKRLSALVRVKFFEKKCSSRWKVNESLSGEILFNSGCQHTVHWAE